MLHINRKVGEQVVILTSLGEMVTLTVERVVGSSRVALSFDGPKSVVIHRSEIFKAMERDKDGG
jgi:carbon storage regulator CsrA